MLFSSINIQPPAQISSRCGKHFFVSHKHGDETAILRTFRRRGIMAAKRRALNLARRSEIGRQLFVISMLMLAKLDLNAR